MGRVVDLEIRREDMKDIEFDYLLHELGLSETEAEAIDYVTFKTVSLSETNIDEGYVVVE